MPGPFKSIYADIHIKGQHRALRTPRVGRPWRPRVLAWAGPAAFYRNRFYEIDKWYKARITKPEKLPKLHIIDPDNYWKSLEERLNEANKLRHNEQVDIGYALPEISASAAEKEEYKAKREQLESAARNKQLLVDLKAVAAVSKVGESARRIAEHYGIFRDLFHPDAFFHPVVPLTVHYDFDEESVSPVHLGNSLTPHQTVKQPTVSYEADKSSLWTLLVSNPDGNPFEVDKEIVHWLVGNIPGNDLSKGEVVFDYLQPLPFKGTGYHRIVFTLFRQDNGPIDFGQWNAKAKDKSLEARTFSTPQFYKSNEDALTPAGLAFFQTSWDSSCQRCLYDRFSTTHPLYKYEWPAPLKMKQEEYPDKPQPFNLYLDQFRDSQDIEEELLKKRLTNLTPFKPPPQKPKYPDIFWKDNKLKMPEWQHARLVKENSAAGKYRSVWKNEID